MSLMCVCVCLLGIAAVVAALGMLADAFAAGGMEKLSYKW